MVNHDFQEGVARTLLYYEIFEYPLTAKELFTLFPTNSLSFEQFSTKLDGLVAQNSVVESHGFYHLPQNNKDFSTVRSERERLALKRIKLAKIFTFLIKQFPFVRGVFLSGELSKTVASPDGDIDYVIVTATHRLWITRSLLILFKKIFLFNRKKYFCLNYFMTENHLRFDQESYYMASEIAHLKPLYNFPLFLTFINSNGWIKKYFPNYTVFALTNEPHFETPGLVQKVIEPLFSGKWVNSLDSYLMNKMKAIWRQRYNEYDRKTHEHLFLSTADESRTFVGNFSEKISNLYAEKLKSHNLS